MSRIIERIEARAAKKMADIIVPRVKIALEQELSGDRLIGHVVRGINLYRRASRAPSGPQAKVVELSPEKRALLNRLLEENFPKTD